MKFAIFASALASLASSAVGLPQYPGGYENCISQSAAEKLVAEYSAVIAHESSDLGGPAKTARLITAPGYTETSDSANFYLGIPIGSVTVPSKKVFVQSSQSNPAVVSTTISVHHSCDTITWQWVQLNFGSGQYEVKGFHLFYVNDQGKLTKSFFEFNSVAGGLDTGYTITTPNGTVIT